MTDREKLTELYRIYEKPLYRIAFAVLHDHTQAEDAVSEAFCRVIRHIGRIGEPESPQTKQYMIRVIRSTSFTQYRKNQRHAERFQPMDEHHAEIADPDDMLHRRIERSALLETLASLLGILNETDRQIVVWHGRDGIPFAQIAERLGMTEPSVRKRYERARKRMTAGEPPRADAEKGILSGKSVARAVSTGRSKMTNAKGEEPYETEDQ